MENSQRPMFLFLGIYIFSVQWILTHQQVNVALKGIAAQSSVYARRYASLAIDGNRESNAFSYSCTTTNAQYNPWWSVDLLAMYDINNVIVTNRGDCCPERINGGEIHIGNSLINNGNNNPRCVIIPSIAAGASENYTCKMRGCYVNIILPSVTQYLTLCEVEVYGVPVPVTKRTFLRIKFNSSEDLSNPTMRDKVLQKIKSANIQSSVFQIHWTKEPELETDT
ncbi:fucolectin-like [Hemibagrus wyckioides]|uniref:fucolectin-like n=1 Tax=Hemibagrus wyckioides TaxID=337641 RepID=UPI00266B710E|nr:fucolectin-like [Hemibagrus wyckioides]